MARRKLALIAALPGLLAPAWAQSLSDSCYWTSTVIYGAQSTLYTFSSMNPPPVSSSSSSLLGSASVEPDTTNVEVSSIVSSITSTSATSSSTPSISPDEQFIVQVVVAPRKAKRDTQYISFGGEFAILVDDKSSAATFEISEDGYLATSGGNFVGPSSLCEDCKVALLKDEMPPSSPPFWNRWFIDSSSLGYRNGTFCIATNNQLFVVFGDDGSDDCQGVSFVGELAAESISTTTPSGATVIGSLTTTATVSDTVIDSASGTSAVTTGTTSSVEAPVQSSTSSLASQSSSSTFLLPSSSALNTAASSISTSTDTTTISIHSTSSTTSPADPSSQAASQPSSSHSTSIITSASSLATSAGGSTSSSSVLPPTSTLLDSASILPTTSSTSISSSRPSSSSSSSTIASSSSLAASSPTSIPISTSTLTTTSHSTTSTASTSSASPTSNSLTGKRGLAYANVNQTYYYPPPSQVSWTYNYYYSPNSSSSRGIFPRTSSYPLRFIPLLFNDDPSLAANWIPAATYAIANYGSDALFSFNEPDLCVDGSACMTVQRALVGYNKSMQPFAGQTRLVAPAITNAGSGFTWLREFLGNASLPQWNLTIDIVNIHWYASPYNMQYFIDYMTQASVIANGRPVWITEYGMDQTYQEPAVQQFMRNTTYWCDQQNFIERYAWFGNYPNNLLNSAGTALSPRGVIWNSYRGSNYVYGFSGRVAASVAEAKEVTGPSAEEVEEAQEMRKDGDESEWAREGFVEKMWWKGDGHMDGK